MQVRRREEAADHASADMARKIAALDQKDKSAAEKEQSLSSLTAELWAKVKQPHHFLTRALVLFPTSCVVMACLRCSHGIMGTSHCISR